MQALDLACGDGRYTVTLAAAGYDVVAVDDLPEAIERAEWLAGELGVLDAIEFRKASLPEAFASLGSFNFVICGSCFLHLLGRPTTENIIDLVQKSTRAGGVNYICLSTDVIRRLPCGRRFFYDGEASYAVAEAETVLRQMYAHWDILLLEKQPVQEEWDIPPVAYQYLQAKHYQRTEVELTFAARAPGLKE
jgi:SAM-dependent methyltransferase